MLNKENLFKLKSFIVSTLTYVSKKLHKGWNKSA